MGMARGIKMLKFRRIILGIVILSLVITIPLLSYAKSLPKFSFGSRLLYTGTMVYDFQNK